MDRRPRLLIPWLVLFAAVVVGACHRAPPRRPTESVALDARAPRLVEDRPEHPAGIQRVDAASLHAASQAEHRRYGERAIVHGGVAEPRLGALGWLAGTLARYCTQASGVFAIALDLLVPPVVFDLAPTAHDPARGDRGQPRMVMGEHRAGCTRPT